MQILKKLSGKRSKRNIRNSQSPSNSPTSVATTSQPGSPGGKSRPGENQNSSYAYQDSATGRSPTQGQLPLHGDNAALESQRPLPFQYEPSNVAASHDPGAAHDSEDLVNRSMNRGSDLPLPSQPSSGQYSGNLMSNSDANRRGPVTSSRNIPLPGTSTPPARQQYMPGENMVDARGTLSSTHRQLGSLSSKNSSHPIADEYSSSSWYQHPDTLPAPVLGNALNREVSPGFHNQSRQMDLQPSNNHYASEEVSDVSRLSSYQPQGEYGTWTNNNRGNIVESRFQSGPYVGHQYDSDLHQTTSIRHEPQSPDLHGDYIRQSSENPRGIDSDPSRNRSPQLPGPGIDKPLPYAPQQYPPMSGRDSSSQSPQQIPRKPIADKQPVLERPRAVSTQKYAADLPGRTPFDRHRQSFEARPVMDNVQQGDVQRTPFVDNLSKSPRDDYQQTLQQDPRATATITNSQLPTNNQQKQFDYTSDLGGPNWGPQMAQHNPPIGVPIQTNMRPDQRTTEVRPFMDYSQPSPFVEERALGPIAPETLPGRPDTIKHGPRQLQREPSFNPHAPEPFSLENEIQPGHQQAYHRPLVVKDAPEAPSLKGIVDLSNTVDTSVRTNWAQPVVHETVYPKVHHVREEVYTREIHDEHIYDRILPIIDVQVLPAKYFAAMGPNREFVEVPAPAVAARTGGLHGGKNWVIAETVTKIPAGESHLSGPRRFTARTFQGTEGDERHWVDVDGVDRSEQTWVHPPTVAIGGRMRGLTEAVHFGLDDEYSMRETQLSDHLSHNTRSEHSPHTGGALSGYPQSEDSRIHSSRAEYNSGLQESSGYSPDSAPQLANVLQRQGQESLGDKSTYQRNFSQYPDSSIEPRTGMQSSNYQEGSFGRGNLSGQPRQDVNLGNGRSWVGGENDSSFHPGHGLYSSKDAPVASGPYQPSQDYSRYSQTGIDHGNNVGSTAVPRIIPGAFGGDSARSQHYLESPNPNFRYPGGENPSQDLRGARTSNNHPRDMNNARDETYRTPMGGADGSYDRQYGDGSNVKVAGRGEGHYDANEHVDVGMAR